MELRKTFPFSDSNCPLPHIKFLPLLVQLLPRLHVFLSLSLVILFTHCIFCICLPCLYLFIFPLLLLFSFCVLKSFFPLCSVTQSCMICFDPMDYSWTIACKAPLSMKFSRQEYWSGSCSIFSLSRPLIQVSILPSFI